MSCRGPSPQTLGTRAFCQLGVFPRSSDGDMRRDAGTQSRCGLEPGHSQHPEQRGEAFSDPQLRSPRMIIYSENEKVNQETKITGP